MEPHDTAHNDIDSSTDAIAIVGMSCRFPGASNNIDGYWKVLSEGSHIISDIPNERFDAAKYYDVNQNIPGTMYVKKGAFIDGISEFDAEFFDISPREAIAMDPQQRILLECVWEALEDSMVIPSSLMQSKTGVFVGVIYAEYKNLLENSIKSAEYEPFIPTGSFLSAVAGRVSYTFGFEGPSMTIDTHCSSSLVALHEACQSLRNNKCERAIVAGTHAILSPENYILFCRNGTLAPDGVSKTFDKGANGYGRGEGCGVLVLKRLSDAMRDGDKIHAVIRGSAVNQDGHGSAMTAPNPNAQIKLIQEALADAKLESSQISYIEAHGTGTPVGDPIEITAISEAFKINRDKNNPLIIGSAKTNIGHLEAAAGIAGVIKVILSLKNKQIPAHLHFKELNPAINLNQVPIVIPTKLTSWNAINGRRIAGVNSFGITGTNAHTILEEAPEILKNISNNENTVTENNRDLQVLCISGKNKQALDTMVQRYDIAIAKDTVKNIGDFCFSANTTREHFEHRLAVISSSKEQMHERIAEWQQYGTAPGVISSSVNYKDGKIAFLFTGGGSQYVGMGKKLYDSNATFKDNIDLCATILSDYWEHSLQSVMWGANAVLLDRMDYMQPALFALEYSLAQLWKSWGIKPYGVIGHSLGEYVAATIAGVFSLEDGLKLIAKRAQFMHKAPGNGAMASLAASAADVLEVLKNYENKVTIGAINGPLSTIISGDRESVVEILAQFKARDVKVKLLPISNASHSPLMQPILQEFESEASKIIYSQPSLAMISNVSGDVVQGAEVCDPRYWSNHIRQTVKFYQGMQALYNLGCRYFIEIGPQSTLLGMGQACVPTTSEGLTEGLWVTSLEKDKDDWEMILSGLSNLYVNGFNPDWNKFDQDYVRNKIDIPTYAFQRKKYWLDRNIRSIEPYTTVNNNELKTDKTTNQDAPTLQNNKSDNQFVQSLLNTSANLRKDSIAELLKNEIRKILGLSHAVSIDPNAGLMSMGMTSLLAGELINALTKVIGPALKETLPKTLMFSYPTVNDIADYLLSEGLNIEQKKTYSFKGDRRTKESIAIVGMSCRFPGGANSLDEYWQMLVDGLDTISDIPRSRFNIDKYYDPDVEAPHKMYVKGGAFLDSINLFDAEFFGISPREAIALDPQQRLLLEVSWEAIENSGVAADKIYGSNTGVFVGIMSHDYETMLQNSASYDDYQEHVATGNLMSTAAGRISYTFGFKGPAMSVDTACSSSLVSIHLACDSLRNNSCDVALAAGVNVIASPDGFIKYSKIHALAADAHCKTFDAKADGYARGEGCGVLVLKRLSDAIANGDNVLAVIRGSAVNQDGRSSSLTAPNGIAQESLLAEALHNAKLQPYQIGYVEAHGTGTPLGDPIEIRSLGRVLKEGRNANTPLIIASVKTNIGHTESAAGVAGVIKTVLALQHKKIPPHRNLQSLNPEIHLEEIPAIIPDKLIDWLPIDGRRIAGVSSFGISGTNAHLILEESPLNINNIKTKTADYIEKPEHILTISAKNIAALREMTSNYISLFEKHNTIDDLINICYSTNLGKNQFNSRLAVIGDNGLSVKNSLGRWLQGEQDHNVVQNDVNAQIKPKIAFLFTGQGSQFVGMGKELYKTNITFKKSLDNCAAILANNNLIDKDLMSLLWGENSGLLDETKYTQPALFSLEYSLYKLWSSWGVNPDFVMGHSVGEYVAATVANVFTLDDGLKLISKRASLMQALPQDGAMASIAVSESQLLEIIKQYEGVAIAAENEPESTVISGKKVSVESIVNIFAEQGIKTKYLKVSHAFHSPLLEPMLNDFSAVLSTVNFATPTITIVSNVTGKIATKKQLMAPQYWLDHTRNTVRFSGSIQSLVAENCTCFLEIGPQPILIGMGQENVNSHLNHNLRWLASSHKDKSEWHILLQSLSNLYIEGVTIDWDGFDKDYIRNKIALPTYPFQRENYWLDASSVASLSENSSVIHINEKESNMLDDKDFYEIIWHHDNKNNSKSDNTKQKVWLLFVSDMDARDKLKAIIESSGDIAYFAIPTLSTNNLGQNDYEQLAYNTFYLNISNYTHCAKLVSHISKKAHDNNSNLEKIVYLLELKYTNDKDVEEMQRIIFGTALTISQGIIATKQNSFRLYFVTCGAQAVNNEQNKFAVHQSTLWGLGRTIALEENLLGCTNIDLDPSYDHLAPESLQNLYAEISNSYMDDQVAFRGKQRFLRRLIRKASTNNAIISKNELQHEIIPNSTYIITGGLGGLGLNVASLLVSKSATNLVLISRGQPNEQAKNQIKSLEALGAVINILRLDVSVEQDVINSISNIHNTMPPIKGIIHAAGSMDSGSILEQTWEKYVTVTRPKIFGAINLFTAIQKLDIKLDFFINFSSASSILGNIGHCNYAAANAFLDTFAFYQRLAGMNAVSIDWGAWEHIGLTANISDTQQQAEYGLASINLNVGIKALEKILSSNDIVQIVYINVNWNLYVSNFVSAFSKSFFGSLITDVKRSKDNDYNAERQKFKKGISVENDDKKQFVFTFVLEQVKHVLKMPKEKVIDVSVGIRDLGMDSLLSVEFKNRLNNILEPYIKSPLTASLIYNYTTIKDLANYLSDEMLITDITFVDSEKNSSAEDVTSKITSNQNESIAIVGIGCRFPGGINNPDDFWNVLANSKDCITDIPEARFDVNQYYDPNPDVPGKMYPRGGGFIEQAEFFDAGFFGISPREALAIDPQQRQLLEVCWDAIENSMLSIDTLQKAKTGVFVGMAAGEYQTLIANSNEKDDIQGYTLTGNAANAASGRVSYTFGFDGPSMTVDTACSSSLVAIHLACQSLNSGTSDVAFAAGVNIICSPETYILMSRTRALAFDSHCKTFDANADGYARGEGCGVVILKKLSVAISDGDNILAVIKGSAVNQDGRSTSFTAPNGLMQQELITSALATAQVEPHQISYIEAHGTGTPLGDPIEVQSLGKIFRRNNNNAPLIIGTVKTNIGHTESAAGIAGVIKVVLSLQHKQIPANLNFNTLNPNIDLNDIPAIIPVKLTEWVTNSNKRIAGVSGFGISGTNAHVIIEEYIKKTIDNNVLAINTVKPTTYLLTISAKDKTALDDLTQLYLSKLLINNTDDFLANLCYTANMYREKFRYQLAVCGNGSAHIIQSLQDWLQNGQTNNVYVGEDLSQGFIKTAFLFTGQGSQYIGMGKELYAMQSVFKENIDRCSELMKDYVDKDLKSLLWGENSNLLEETIYTQPTLFALEYSIFKLWQSWGVVPYAVMGHSVGEYVAACVAGVMSLEDGLKIITARAKLMYALPKNGSMAAISVNFNDVNNTINDLKCDIYIAAINSTESTVVSGLTDQVDKIISYYETKNIKTTRLKVSHAFHSKLLNPMIEDFKKILHNINFSKPTIKLISNLTGNIVNQEMINPEYWLSHTLQPVAFASGIESLVKLEISNFIEIGPHPVLISMAQENINNLNILWVNSLKRDTNDETVMISSLCKLLVNGMRIDWQSFYKTSKADKINLPNYPFQHKKYWVEHSNKTSKINSTNGELLGQEIFSPLSDSVVYEALYDIKNIPLLEDHKVYNTVVVPGACHIARILIWVVNVQHKLQCTLKEISFNQAIILLPEQAQLVQMILEEDEKAKYNFQIYSAIYTAGKAQNIWDLNATGQLEIGARELLDVNKYSMLNIKNKCNKEIDVADYEKLLVKDRYQYGPGFIWVDKLWVSDDRLEVLALMRNPSSLLETKEYILHPGFIDCCFQLLIACIGNSGRSNEDVAYIPITIGEFEFHSIPKGRVWCHVSLDNSVNKTEKLMSGNVEIYSDNGTPDCIVKQFTLIQAEKTALIKTTKNAATNSIYEMEWTKHDFSGLKSATHTLNKWLIFMPADKVVADSIDAMLLERDGRTVKVYAGDHYEQMAADKYLVRAAYKQDFESMFTALANDFSINNIIYIWPIDVEINQTFNIVELERAQQSLYEPLLNLAQILNTNKYTNINLALVTNGIKDTITHAVDNKSSIAQSPILGFARTLALEMPQNKVVVIDLDTTGATKISNIKCLFDCVSDTSSYETQVVIKNGTANVARLVNLKSNIKNSGLEVPKTESYQLTFNERGSFDNLKITPSTRKMPGANEIEIRIHASGLNFRDVMNVLGVYPGDAGNIGGECAGEVVNVGEGVTNFKVGDRVMCLGFGCLASHVTVPVSWVLKQPDFLSYEQAATIPVTFVTAYYGLNYLAKLKKGERVLIHAGAGGVGLAAIQLAQAIGAEIFATVGNQSKKDLMLSIGVQEDHIFNSRNLDFAEQIMTITNNEGIDVVQNSLSGEFIPKSMGLLRAGGRFVEIGKTGIWTEAQALEFNPKISYFKIALDYMMQNERDLLVVMLDELMHRFSNRELQPLVFEIFTIVNVTDAFRFMSQGKHIGKVVITQDAITSIDDKAIKSIKAEGSYLITGGLGDLGLLLTDWLVNKGAEHIILTGRSGASASALKRIATLETQGVKVKVVAADIAIEQDVTTMFTDIIATMPPILGIFHAAGVLDDGFLEKQDYYKYLKVAKPKIFGAYNIHNSLLKNNINLDFLIYFSAAAALLGNASQINYSAANSFLDAFAGLQRSQSIPVLSINWGPWSQLGMAAHMSKSSQEMLELNGMNFISPEKGIEALNYLFNNFPNNSEVAILDMNWQKYLRMFGDNVPKIYTQLQTTKDVARKTQHGTESKLESNLIKAKVIDRQEILCIYMESELRRLFKFESNYVIERNVGLTTLGMDSLMSVEFRNNLTKDLGNLLSKNLPATLTFNYPSIKALAEYILKEMIVLDDAPVDKEKVKEKIEPNVVSIQNISEDTLAQEYERALKQAAENLGNGDNNG